jgi:hypothetical protein
MADVLSQRQAIKGTLITTEMLCSRIQAGMLEAATHVSLRPAVAAVAAAAGAAVATRDAECVMVPYKAATRLA